MDQLQLYLHGHIIEQMLSNGFVLNALTLLRWKREMILLCNHEIRLFVYISSTPTWYICFESCSLQISEFIGTSWFGSIATIDRDTSENLVSESSKQVEAPNSRWIRGSQYGKYGACGSAISACTGIIPRGECKRFCSTTTPTI